jgi:hypothetical protein
MDEQYALHALSRQPHRHLLEIEVIDRQPSPEHWALSLHAPKMHKLLLGLALVCHPRSIQAMLSPPSFVQPANLPAL